MTYLRKKFVLPTYIKYFLSYLLILTVLILGFYLILRNQVLNSYTEQSLKTVQKQLDDISSQMETDLVYLSLLDSSLITNNELINYRYKNDDSYRFLVSQEIKKHLNSAQLVQSIVYLPKQTGIPFSTRLNVTWKDEIFHIKSSSQNTITFDPTPYLDATNGQLLILPVDNEQYLLYFPSISSDANYIFFYTLDTAIISQRMNNLVSDTVLSVALIDSNKQIATGINTSLLSPYLDHTRLEEILLNPDSLMIDSDILRVDSSTSLCYHAGFYSGFTLVSLLSNDFLSDQISNAFTGAYLALILLSGLGLILIMLAMHVTYTPLHRLTHKIVPNFDARQPHLHQLEGAFSETDQMNHMLESKLKTYRLSIQKSLLDSMLTAGQSNRKVNLPNIDQFFDTNLDKRIYAVHISSPDGTLDLTSVSDYFQKSLSDQDICLVLEYDTDSAVFLINCVGTQATEDPLLLNLLHRLYDELGIRSAISNSSDSPLDIPSLYENARHASKFWTQIPVVDFSSMPHNTAVARSYPHEKLEQLSKSLSEHNFQDARAITDELFRIADDYTRTEAELSDFFVHCILVDILTNIINCMNQNYVNFSSYNELYYSTLYFCRSCPYEEKARDIADGINRLLDICEQEVAEKQITAPFKQMIDECYCQPDFSITVLADKFHVSVAYMSYWFKQELNTNFSDYLWTLRLKKAKELLSTTDMSIDEISVAVGYVNTSSFRRKLKQETGLTPSQLRNADGVE